MNFSSLIAPTSLRDYAKDHGWVRNSLASRDRLLVMDHPDFARRQLAFPLDTTAPDYQEAVELVVAKLAEIERREPAAVLRNVLEVGDDSIAFRLDAPRLDQGSLPLSFAAAMVAGAQQLLLASACTVLKPQTHHPRLGRSEAQQFLEVARFRHTAPGSFVLNVSCPVHAMDAQVGLWPDEPDLPFVRRATMALYQGLSELVAAIEADSVDQLVSNATHSSAPVLSSNLCEALGSFEDASLRNSLDLSISWAGAIARPANAQRVSTVRIQHDYFGRVEEVRRALRAKETHVDAVFFGTVERLDGEMGDDGMRSGEVILSILTADGVQVRARANLNSQQYAYAINAHQTEGAFVKIAGRLHPGRQPRLLSDISLFERTAE